MSAPPSFWHPASLLGTWFGSGLLPRVPGTWGSLAAIPFAVGLARLGGTWALLLAAAVLFPIGVWAATVYARRTNREDPQEIVIDEVVGQWIALAPAALDFGFYPIAFLAFRVFDIVKVWPANVLERRFAGGLGIMADDVAAGVYAAAVTSAAVLLLRL